MFDFLVGELLLPLKRAQQLTWEEVDSLYAGQDVRRQKDLVGFRRLSTQLYNLMPDAQAGPLTEAQYLPLPALDGPPPAPKGQNPAWRERMKQKYGDKLEA